MFPPVDPTRRRLLRVAAGSSIASVGALTVAAMPATAPDMLPSHPSDDRLVAAAEGLFASESAIDQLYRDHGDCDVEVDERADCQALFAVQDKHIETLISVPATSTAGLRAKASVVRAHFMVGRLKHQSLAVSLADDLVRLDKAVQS